MDVSVNWTDWLATGEPGLEEKDAVRGAPMVTVRLALVEPVPLLTVKVTVFVPAVVYAWLGFWAVLVDPSPKFHDQAAGLPADMSVNCTDWPVTGDVGANVKEAERAGTTVRVWLDALELEPFETVRVTVLAPAVE